MGDYHLDLPFEANGPYRGRMQGEALPSNGLKDGLVQRLEVHGAINSRTHAACLLPCFTIPAAIGLRQPGPQGPFGHEITEILIQFHIGRIL